MDKKQSESAQGPHGKPLVIALAVGAAAVGSYFATGMPGMDHEMSADGSADGAGAESMDEMPFMSLAPEEFAARVGQPGSIVVNVHIPYEGELEGTDEFVPFDEIVGDSRLPEDKDAEIVLYCRSGRMSAIAADALVAAGYTDVVDLDGGMEAWEEAGMFVRSTASPAAEATG